MLIQSLPSTKRLLTILPSIPSPLLENELSITIKLNQEVSDSFSTFTQKITYTFYRTH